MKKDILSEQIFIKRLIMLTDKANLSIFQLASKTKIPQATISGWIKNIRTPKKLKHFLILTTFFNCSTDYLLGLEDEFGNKFN